MRPLSCRRMRCAAPLIAVTAVTVLAVAQLPADESGAKALFLTGKGELITMGKSEQPKSKAQASAPRPSSSVGIRYWFELEGVGYVAENRSFRTGDRIRLHLQSNTDGYLTVWSLDPQGRGVQLYPEAGSASTANLVHGYQEFVTPGYIRFTEPVEDERLVVFFSKSRGTVAPPLGTEQDGAAASRAIGEGSKALIMETEAQRPDQIGTYVVRQNAASLVKEITLKHVQLGR